jgi:glycine/D-amino acid oxidase-like deaminating enzyme
VKTAPASLWWSTLPDAVTARATLRQDLEVDVCIVGGGFTGLWTARELLRRDPSLRVVVLEQSVCGFGASGRNGGWASALYPLSDDVVRRRYGEAAFVHQRHVLRRAVSDLGASARADGIDAHFVQGGTITMARSELQAERLQQLVAEHDDPDLTWCSRSQALERVGASDLHGATYSPHCARIHPARLVRGLSQVVEALGAQIFEDTTVLRIVPGTSTRQATALTANATVRARYIVRATEGYTANMAGHRRDFAPVFSLMIATQVLPESFWQQAKLAQYETFADDRHLIIYGQRTNDDRLAFGGRGAPYHFGSAVEERYDHSRRVFSLLESTLHEIFPYLSGAVEFSWGGPLAMPRDLSPAVHVNHDTGLAYAGGYTGDGVVLSRVAGQALAELITDPTTLGEFSSLPFVQRRSRQWEFEPLRWIGINAGLALAARADHVEARSGTTSRASALLDRLFDQFPP